LTTYLSRWAVAAADEDELELDEEELDEELEP
jgi:hypothetical protein